MTPTETARAVPGSEHGLKHPRPLRPSPRGLTRWRGAPPPFPRPGPPAPQRGGRHALGRRRPVRRRQRRPFTVRRSKNNPVGGRPDSPARASSTAARPRSDCLPAAPAPAHPRIRAPTSASHQIKNGAPPGAAARPRGPLDLARRPRPRGGFRGRRVKCAYVFMGGYTNSC